MFSKRFRRLLLLTLGLLPVLGLLSARAQDDDLPPNLGHELHSLVQWHRTQTAAADAKQRQLALRTHLETDARGKRVQTDGAGAVIVNIHLDGSVPAAEVEKNLAAMGLTVTSVHAPRRADGRDGTLSAHLPLDRAVDAAKTPGVFSVLVAHRPRVRVGKVTSQGVAALHADTVQSTYTGTGITVGVISDSYDKATADSAGYAPSTRAADDIASGDLPSAGVTVLKDATGDAASYATDEGRAMLQIVHDMAPGATLAFCSSGDTTDEFADNIRALRTSSNTLCDVIVDDIGFDDEPFFSDGVVAQAVDDVVTSSALSGNKVIYYSAAGNDGDLSYQGTFVPVTDAAGRAAPEGLDFTNVPDNLTANGFHDFQAADIGHGKKFVQTVTVSGDDAYLNFQWDDPFISGGITTDYNILVFDADGNYRNDLSGNDDNFNTGEAFDEAYLPLNEDGSDTTYRIVISRGAGGSGTAKHLRYIVEQDSGTVTGKYLRTAQPTIYGHPAAANADGIAAYDVHDLSTPEYYESFGPVTIYFDAEGNRLATPEVRVEPTMATVDGVDTTFFPEGPLDGDEGTDSDGDGFPNFYGTSAAAPHAAGVAALLLQAAGGKLSLTAVQMRTLLESTAASHDLDAATSLASFTSADGLFTVSAIAKGDASNDSAFDSKFFTLTFTGPAGSSLHKAIIDLGPTKEDFDPTTATGYPFTIGLATDVITTGLVDRLSTGVSGIGNSRLLIKVPRNNFPTGATLAFGIDRDDATLNPPSGGNDADLLAGATITAKFINADGTSDKAVGTLANKIGTGLQPGRGLRSDQRAGGFEQIARSSRTGGVYLISRSGGSGGAVRRKI